MPMRCTGLVGGRHDLGHCHTYFIFHKNCMHTKVWLCSKIALGLFIHVDILEVGLRWLDRLGSLHTFFGFSGLWSPPLPALPPRRCGVDGGSRGLGMNNWAESVTLPSSLIACWVWRILALSPSTFLAPLTRFLFDRPAGDMVFTIISTCLNAFSAAKSKRP